MLVQYVSEAILDARHENGIILQPAACQRAECRGQFKQCDVAGAEGQRRHRIQRTVYAHPARIERNQFRVHELCNHASRDGVFRLGQPFGKAHHASRRLVVRVLRLPYYLGDRIHIRERTVGELMPGGPSIVDRRRVDERLECRSGLPSSFVDMVVPLGLEVSSAHPGFDVPGMGIDGYEAGLEPRLGCCQRIHERRIIAKLDYGVVWRHPGLAQKRAVALRALDERHECFGIVAPVPGPGFVSRLLQVRVERIPEAAPVTPFVIHDRLEALHIFVYGLLRNFLHS